MVAATPTAADVGFVGVDVHSISGIEIAAAIAPAVPASTAGRVERDPVLVR